MTHATFRSRILALALAAVFLTVSAAWSAGEVMGRYIGNGKEAKLVHAMAVPREPSNGEIAYTLILAEKDPAGARKPEADCMFGKLGHALLVDVDRKGNILSTIICHQALEKKGFSSGGTLFVEDFKIDGNQLSGRFFTKEKEEFFGDTWEIDLTVKTTLP